MIFLGYCQLTFDDDDDDDDDNDGSNDNGYDHDDDDDNDDDDDHNDDDDTLKKWIAILNHAVKELFHLCACACGFLVKHLKSEWFHL